MPVTEKRPSNVSTVQNQIAEQIQRQIESGEFKPGDRLPSFSQMRDQHGIAPVTVERIYAKLERLGLVVREQGRGTFVAPPKERATGIIGINVGRASRGQSHPYFLHLLDGIHDAADEEGYQIMLLNQDTPIKWEMIEGVLNTHVEAKSILQGLPAGVPCVSVVSMLDGVHNVLSDDTRGIYEATQHLLALGHRRIACLTSHDDNVRQRRMHGYRKAMDEAGIAVAPEWIRKIDYDQQTFYRGGGITSMTRWLAEDWHTLGCTALLAHNDEAAIGVQQVLTAAGLRVPYDVSIVGFDGTEIAEYTSPTLTTVEVPLRQLGATALKLLVEQIREAAPSEASGRRLTIHLPTKLVVRASTAPPVRA